jgi:trimethylamine:corrinoid methyltransferase-like protein
MGRAVLNELNDTHLANVNILVPRINDLLERFGEYRAVTSGIRTMADHTRIYKEINAKRKAQGLPERPVPMSSKHLSCEAVDLEDANDKLKNWCMKNLDILEEIGLWMEHPSATDTWCHLQCVAPKSGNRVFYP